MITHKSKKDWLMERHLFNKITMRKLIEKIKDFWLWLIGKSVKNQIQRIEYPNYAVSIYFDDEIVCLINKLRINNGLNDLILSQDICNIAASHLYWLSNDRVRNLEDFTKYGHYFFQERANQIQLRYKNAKVGENVGYNFKTPKSYVSAWNNSEKHRETMLGDYNVIGVASNSRFSVTIYAKI